MRLADPRSLSRILTLAVVFVGPALPEADRSSTAGSLSAAAASQALGRQVYNLHCYVCHGYSGDARTLAARFLQPPPRDFVHTDSAVLPRAAMIRAVREGREGTAMQPYQGILSQAEIEAVVDFVRLAFMDGREVDARYHTAENGWPEHERFRAAFPFATGEIPLDRLPETLDAGQQAGRRLYLSSCVSCHDRSRVDDSRPRWEPQAVSFPRLGFRPGDGFLPPDAVTGASPFARHDLPPRIPDLSAQARQGEALFQANCAFCHAADGTGRNWIGSFLEPRPRDLTDPRFMSRMTSERLRRVIREGLSGTAMPAWGRVLTAPQIEAIVAYVERAFHPLADTAGPSR